MLLIYLECLLAVGIYKVNADLFSNQKAILNLETPNSNPMLLLWKYQTVNNKLATINCPARIRLPEAQYTNGFKINFSKDFSEDSFTILVTSLGYLHYRSLC